MTLRLAVAGPAKLGHTHRISMARQRLAGRQNLSSVVYSSPRKRARITPLHLKDTASILAPAWRHLAPCLGAALTCSPVAGNIMRLGDGLWEAPTTESPVALDLYQSGQLASLLFFQLIRESPLNVTRNKSLPAAHVSPSLVGSLLGLSLFESPRDTVATRLRHEHGIKSNYIQDIWTGVSLARWKDLVLFQNPNVDPTILPLRHTLATSLWLVVLWEISQSKEDFLDFLLACEKCLPSHHPDNRILDPNNELAQALCHDPMARREWANDTFDPSDISPKQVQSSLEELFHSANDPNFTSSGRALEVLCAGMALEQIPIHGKPASPNGYFQFDGGDFKADCAEVAVREILDLLLWDEDRGSFDLTRLPSTASPILQTLYRPTVETPVTDLSGGPWFEALSNIPGCGYLAASPNGKSYELAPTIENIVRALQHLLVGNNAGTDPWTNLHDLAVAWTAQPLYVSEQVLTHRSGESNKVIEHEFASLRLGQNSSGIELRLRCDWANESGMAAVTHLRQQRQLVEAEQVDLLLSRRDNTLIQILGLAVAGDRGLQRRCDSSVPVDSRDTSRVVLDLLAAPFGCDRRVLSTQELDELQCQSEQVSKAAIAAACQLGNSDPPLGSTVLPWVLAASPTVMEGTTLSMKSHDDRIEDLVMALPLDVLASPNLQSALESNWSCRGRALAKWAQWKCGDISYLNGISSLGVHDLPAFTNFCYRG